jgi:hypothetical protein
METESLYINVRLCGFAGTGPATLQLLWVALALRNSSDYCSYVTSRLDMLFQPFSAAL